MKRTIRPKRPTSLVNIKGPLYSMYIYTLYINYILIYITIKKESFKGLVFIKTLLSGLIVLFGLLDEKPPSMIFKAI